MYGVRGLGVCWCVCMRVHVLKTTCKHQKTHVLPSLCACENMIAETPLHFVHVFVRMYASTLSSSRALVSIETSQAAGRFPLSLYLALCHMPSHNSRWNP